MAQQDASTVAEGSAIKKIAQMHGISEKTAADWVSGQPVLKKSGEFSEQYEVPYTTPDDSHKVIRVMIKFNHGHPYAKKVTG